MELTKSERESGLSNAGSAFPGGPITIPMGYPLDIYIFWIQSYFAYEFGKKVKMWMKTSEMIFQKFTHGFCLTIRNFLLSHQVKKNSN